MRKYIFLSFALVAISMPLVAGAAIQSPIKSDSLYDFLNGLLGVSVKIILPIAVIVILVAAFLILRAQGDSTKIGNAKKMLTFGLVGVAIVILGAGSSALIMNILGLEDVTGITSPIPLDDYLQSIKNYLKNEEITDPVLKALSETQKKIDSLFTGK